MNDDFLNHFRKPPRADFEAALYQRISKPMTTQTRYPVLRPALIGASMLAVLALAIFAVPSARTFAQNLLQHIGAYEFVQGTPQAYDASKVPGPITIVQNEQGTSIQFTGSDVSEVDGPAEASSVAGFAALVPSYLPAGYGSVSDGYLVMADGGGTVIMNGYHDAAKNFFLVNQWQPGEDDLKQFTREQIVEVTVRGHAGLWLPDAAAPQGKNALVWEENGITYSIISNSLPLEEMLAIAESLN
jgi:uncharacterized protein DUF4367